jgi:hypothetical protein
VYGGLTGGFGGGNLLALGYQPGLSGAQAVAYEALMQAGATPQYARMVANSKRASRVLAGLTEGQIYQILGLDLKPGDLVRELELSIGGSLLGGILGGLGAILLAPETGGLSIPAGIALGSQLGGFAGETAASGLEISSALSQSHPTVSVHPHATPHVQAPRPSFAQNLVTAARALPNAIRSGFQFGTEVGNAFEDAFGAAVAPPGSAPVSQQPMDYESPDTIGPAAQPYEATPSNTLEIPQAYTPEYTPSVSEDTNPVEFTPSSEGPEILPPPPELLPDSSGWCPGGKCAGGPYFPGMETQPSDQPTGGPVFSGQGQGDRIAQLINQAQQEIQTEQQQQQQKQCCQDEGFIPAQQGDCPQGYELTMDEACDDGCCQPVRQQPANQPGQRGVRPINYQPSNQPAQRPDLKPQLDDIQRQLQDLASKEQQPAGQRNIPAEIAQKQKLLNQLHDLQQQNQPQPVTFCMTCQSHEDAIMFLNGEQAACNVKPGSTQMEPAGNVLEI